VLQAGPMVAVTLAQEHLHLFGPDGSRIGGTSDPAAAA